MANYKNITKTLDAIDNAIDVNGTADLILKASDWTQIPNNGLTDSCQTLFTTYRTSIRVIRQSDSASPTWPDAPTEEWS